MLKCRHKSSTFVPVFNIVGQMKIYTDPILTLFSENVRHYRTLQNLSQEDLAFRAGVHRTYIGMVERCERNVSLIFAEKIADALEIPLTELLKKQSHE